MTNDHALVGSTTAVNAAIAALKNQRPCVMQPRLAAVDEASREAYQREVRAEMFAAYGIPTPPSLDRLIAEAAMQALSAQHCAAFIGDYFGLKRL